MWLRRFRDPFPLQQLGAFHFYRATDTDGQPRLVIVSRSRDGKAQATNTLNEVAELHRLVGGSPHIPKLHGIEHDPDGSYLILDCAPAANIETLLQHLTDQLGERIPYARAMGLMLWATEALEAANKIASEQAAPCVAIGRWTWRNFWVDDSGCLLLLGFGHDLSDSDPTGAPSTSSAVSQAPELAFGLAPSPAADVFGIMNLCFSLAQKVDYPERLTRILSGQLNPEDQELATMMLNAQARAMARTPEQRFQNMGELVADQRRVWEELSCVPEDEETALWLRALVHRWQGRHAPPMASYRDFEAAMESQGTRAGPPTENSLSADYADFEDGGDDTLREQTLLDDDLDSKTVDSGPPSFFRKDDD